MLAVTSDEARRRPQDVPTLKESGIDLEFTNWRGIVAPSRHLRRRQGQVWIDALTKMHASQGWKAELKKRGWTDAFVTGDEFGTFLKEQDSHGRRDPHDPRAGELTMSDTHPPTPPATESGDRAGSGDRAQYGLCAGLAGPRRSLIWRRRPHRARDEQQRPGRARRPVPIILGARSCS